MEIWLSVAILILSQLTSKIDKFYHRIIRPYHHKSKLATVVEGDPKDPFSIVTKPRVKGRALPPFPGLLHFTLILTL